MGNFTLNTTTEKILTKYYKLTGKKYIPILSPVKFSNKNCFIYDNYLILGNNDGSDYDNYYMLNKLFDKKMEKSSVLPGFTNFDKYDVKYIAEIFNRQFIYFEFENILSKLLKDFFTSYYFSEYFEENTENILFYIKYSGFNNLLKEWNKISEKENIRYQRVYGNKFIEMVKERKFKQVSAVSSAFSNYDIVVYSIPENSDKKILKILKKKFNNIISYDEYKKHSERYFFYKLIFISIGTPDNNNYMKEFGQIELSEKDVKFSNISTSKTDGLILFQYENRAEIFLYNFSGNSNIIRLLNKSIKSEKYYIIVKRNIFNKLMDFLKYVLTIL